jgi:hypothetical protein
VATFCFAIVRMEDASLTELFELFRELFKNITFLEGSVFM